LTAGSAGLAAALEAERNETVRFVALGAPSDGISAGRGSRGKNGPSYQLEQAVLRRAYLATDQSARQVMAAAGAIGGSYPARVRQQAVSEVAALSSLARLRVASTQTDTEYASVIRAVLAVGTGAGPAGGGVVRSGQELALIAGLREDVAQQGAILISALGPDLTTEGSFGPDKVTAITTARRREQAAQVALRTGTVRVTFTLPAREPAGAVSVVGDFNGWDPFAHPLRKRSNGHRTAVVTVPAGATLHFRYLAEGGHWFDDDTAGVPGHAGVALTIPA
jgi:hypothetical protein